MPCTTLWQNLFNLRATVTGLHSACQSWWHCYSSYFPGCPWVSLIFCPQSPSVTGDEHSHQVQASWSVFMHCGTTAHSHRREEKDRVTLPAERRGPGCARCWWSPGCPWQPHSSHSICVRLGTAAPGQRESSAYSLFLHTLPRQEDTRGVM